MTDEKKTTETRATPGRDRKDERAYLAMVLEMNPRNKYRACVYERQAEIDEEEKAEAIALAKGTR